MQTNTEPKFFGPGVDSMRRLLSQARSLAGSHVVSIDEMDVVAGPRPQRNEHVERFLAALA